MGKKDPVPAGVTRIQGSDGSMTFDGRYVSIAHKWLSEGGRGEAQFPLAAVSGVTVRNGLILASVTLVIQGIAPRRKRKGDPLTVHGFGKEEAALFRDMVLRARAVVDALPAVPSVAELHAAPGLVGELQQLAELHARGMLTAEEFGIAKAKLLGTSGPEY
jgi:Short C-terminal domain/Domain of unknown function (DUF4429)